MADRELQTLFSATRKGFEGKPDAEVRLTLESFNGARYAAWGAYNVDATKPTKQISIRKDELPGVLAALQRAVELWEKPDEAFTGDLSHHEYAMHPSCPIR